MTAPTHRPAASRGTGRRPRRRAAPARATAATPRSTTRARPVAPLAVVAAAPCAGSASARSSSSPRSCVAEGRRPASRSRGHVDSAFGRRPTASARRCCGPTPLLLAGLAVAVPARAGLFNIGGEGQLLLGAVGADRPSAWPHRRRCPSWLTLRAHGRSAAPSPARPGRRIPRAAQGRHRAPTRRSPRCCSTTSPCSSLTWLVLRALEGPRQPRPGLHRGARPAASSCRSSGATGCTSASSSRCSPPSSLCGWSCAPRRGASGSGSRRQPRGGPPGRPARSAACPSPPWPSAARWPASAG